MTVCIAPFRRCAIKKHYKYMPAGFLRLRGTVLPFVRCSDYLVSFEQIFCKIIASLSALQGQPDLQAEHEHRSAEGQLMNF